METNKHTKVNGNTIIRIRILRAKQTLDMHKTVWYLWSSEMQSCKRQPSRYMKQKSMWWRNVLEQDACQVFTCNKNNRNNNKKRILDWVLDQHFTCSNCTNFLVLLSASLLISFSGQLTKHFCWNALTHSIVPQLPKFARISALIRETLHWLPAAPRAFSLN